MRAPLMGGDFPFPVKYGYSAVGRTADGRRVFVLHPHQDVFLAPAAMCISLPDVVPTRRAVLAANMETALNLTWDAAPCAGERMLVIGAGVVGLLTASLLARIPGAHVTVVDIDATRETLARQVRLRLRLTRPCSSRAGADRACLGQRSGTASRTGSRRLRGKDRRGKLVWRPLARGAARRSLPCAPAAPDRYPGRCCRATDARPTEPRGTVGAGARTAEPTRDTTSCWTGRHGSRICQSRCRASSHRAACATSSPTGPRNLLPESAGRLTARSGHAVGTCNRHFRAGRPPRGLRKAGW